MKKKIQYILENQLPGELRQLKMSPSKRHASNNQIDRSCARNSSVMILLYQNDGEWHFPLIKRALYNGVHSGQVSLPGGKWESFDKNAWVTALRETNEEVGVNSDSIEYLGALTPLYIPHSNFMVYPFVGITDNTPEFKGDAFEVAEIIEASVNSLTSQDKNPQTFSFESQNYQIIAPYYEFNGHQVWGATAMMLSEFIGVLDLSFQNTIDSSHSYNGRNVQVFPSHTDTALHRDNNQISQLDH